MLLLLPGTSSQLNFVQIRTYWLLESSLKLICLILPFIKLSYHVYLIYI